MPRPDGDFTGSLLVVAQRAFTAGCAGCLGVGSAAVVFFLTVFVFFQPQFAALVRIFSFPSPPFVINLQTSATVCPPSPQTAAIEIFITGENKPEAVRVTQIKIPVHEPLFICVHSTLATAVRFSVRIIMPDGREAPFGEFTTDPTGKALCLGPLTGLPNMPGTARVEATIGSAVAGTTTLLLVQ